MITNSATIASFAVPAASGAIGSHAQASHATANSPAIAMASVVTIIRVVPAMRRPMRSMFSVSPAISAISVVAMPLTVWSCRAIGSVITLPR